MKILEKESYAETVQEESLRYDESVRELIELIFHRPEAGDRIERSVSITTMDTSAGGTKTDCACCPKRGC